MKGDVGGLRGGKGVCKGKEKEKNKWVGKGKGRPEWQVSRKKECEWWGEESGHND